METIQQIIIDCKNTKQKLISILLLDCDNVTKLNKIKKLLLELQITDNVEDFKIDNTELEKLIMDKSTEKLKFITLVLEKTFEPFLEQQKLLKEIGDVIRSDISVNIKLDKITDLLI